VSSVFSIELNAMHNLYFNVEPEAALPNNTFKIDDKEPKQINASLEVNLLFQPENKLPVKNADMVLKESTFTPVTQSNNSTPLEMDESLPLELELAESEKLEAKDSRRMELIEETKSKPPEGGVSSQSIQSTKLVQNTKLTPSTAFHSTISVVPTGFDQQVSPTFLKEKLSVVAPGTKDSEGFLAPPPASTLLIRRARVSSTGASTYVVSKSDSSPSLESDSITNEDGGSPQLGDESSIHEFHGKSGNLIFTVQSLNLRLEVYLFDVYSKQFAYK